MKLIHNLLCDCGARNCYGFNVKQSTHLKNLRKAFKDLEDNPYEAAPGYER